MTHARPQLFELTNLENMKADDVWQVLIGERA